MKKFTTLLFIIFLASCGKDDVKPLSTDTINVCFTEADVQRCIECLGSTSDYCISHFDYAAPNEAYGFTDKIITEHDLDFVKRHVGRCDYLKKPQVLRQDGILDFIPAVNPMINEACNTRWDNLSAIRNEDGSLTYWSSIPDYLPEGIHKNRFQFFWEVPSPWQGESFISEGWAMLDNSSYLLEITAYGNTGLVCVGVQPLRVWVKDKVTEQWYRNDMVVNASLLCHGQADCNNGYSYFDITYADYTGDYAVDAPF